MLIPSLATAPTPYASNPIVPLVSSSTYERQVYDFVVLLNPFDPSETWMFASGMDASAEQRIIKFTAPTDDVEDNTATWTYDGIILEAGTGGDWDAGPFGLRLGSMVWDGSEFWLYYNSDDTFAIGLATSSDGSTFTKFGSSPILTPNGQGRDDGDYVSQPSVLKEGSSWTMIYGYRDGIAVLPGLRYATSADGESWTKGGSGDIFTTPLYNEFHHLLKLGDDDYLLLVEVGNVSNPFRIHAARAPAAIGPWSQPDTAWLAESGSPSVPGRYHVATPCLYETPGGLLKLFYCGADNHDQPYATNTWPGMVADVTQLDPALDLTASLGAYYPLDEASGTRADAFGSLDLTDNNTVGNASGVSVAVWQGGAAANFDAANSEYLSHADNAALRGGDRDWTISFWFLQAVELTQQLVSKDSDSPSNARDYTIDVTTGDLRFYLNGGGSVLVSVPYEALVRYLVIAEHDAANNMVRLEVNRGTPATQGTSGLVPETSSAQFRIGARQYSGFEEYFGGIINRVGIWSRLLTTDEKDELYSRGAGLPFVMFNYQEPSAGGYTPAVAALSLAGAALSMNYTIKMPDEA